MKFFKDIRTGIVAYYRSIEFIFVNHLWYFFFFPALIAVGVYFTGDLIRDDLRAVDFRGVGEEDYYQYLVVGLKAIFVFIAFKLNKVLALIVLSPVLTLLSAKTEMILAGNRYPFSFKQFMKDINRGIGIAVRNAVIQLLFIASWLMLCLFVGELLDYTYWFIFTIGFYFYGYSFIDYSNERRGVNMEDGTKFIRRHFGLTVIVGAIFSALFLIPYAGVIVAPITGIVAATMGVHRVVDFNKKELTEVSG